MKYSQVDDPKLPVDRLKVSISIGSKLDQVALLRGAVRGILEELSVPEMESTLLLLAISEAANNSIEHGYRNDSANKVEVLVAAAEQEIRIDILDDAPPLPVNELKHLLQTTRLDEDDDPAGDQWTERGHGMQIIRRAVDKVDFSRINDRNCVTLHKRVSDLRQ